MEEERREELKQTMPLYPRDDGSYSVKAERLPPLDNGYPEGFDASLGLSAHAMRTANGILASLTGKREWDVPMVAAALESYAKIDLTEGYGLLDAARAVVSRWDTPLWKDAPHTGEFINRLREAIGRRDAHGPKVGG